MSRLIEIQHVSVIVADLERALDFYVGLLGLEVSDERPDLGYAGAWLKVGTQQIHLLVLPNPDPVSDRPGHVGRDRHAAFRVTGLDELEQSLAAAGVVFTRSRSGRRALFCRDPDGNGVELIESDTFPVL